MTFERTTDLELIRSCVTHPKVWPFITDDSCCDVKDYQPALHPSVSYVAVREGETLLGIFLLVQHTGCCLEIHTALLPESWGAPAAAAARGIVEWIWQNTSCQRIFTNVPECNRLALRFAKRAGMTVFGINENSFMKNGALWGQIMLGLSKPKGEPCQ